MAALRWLLAGQAVLTAAACADDPVRAPDLITAPAASTADTPGNRHWIPGQYIVQFKFDQVEDVPGLVKALTKADGDSVLFTYTRVIKGFAARLSPNSVEALKRHPLVERVTQDEYSLPDQSAGTWGLDRIDQRYLPLNGIYNPNRNGSGVNIYVMDSGIRRTHAEFDWGARARHTYTAIYDGYGADDCNGHGTHVAATAAGTTYGVAKQATVHAIRIAGCNGQASPSGFIAAADWIAAYRVLPAVANLSHSWSKRQDVEDAAQRLINSGVAFVTSAGNADADACNYSPKSSPSAVVVGNSDRSDWRDVGSNWGSCVGVFAPGVDITSAWYGSDTDTRTISGTSMSSPHVAGVAALYLQGDPWAAPSKVKNAILGSSTTGVVNDTKGSPNRLVYAFPVYFAVSMTGPNAYSSSGYYTWEAHPDGGNGTYTYQWSIYYHATGYYQVLGTGKSQTVYVNQGSGNFTMEVVAASAGQTSSASMMVYDQSGGCGSGIC